MEKDGKGTCRPCEINKSEPKQEDCTLFQDYLTTEEEDSLSMLRRLKKESHEIKDKIRKLEEDLELAPQDKSNNAFHKTQEELHRELRVYHERLEKLRDLWNEWEARRKVANERKMALLGYNP
jgi:hypothetical protein